MGDSGGGSVPQPQTTGQSIQDWIKNYPQIFELQSKYAPQEAAQQVSLAQQYAEPLGQAMKSAQEAMYPDETAFIKNTLSMAQQGQGAGLPNWAKQQYMDTMRAQLGENALAGSGADYMSTGLNQQTMDWQKYYTDLGLSIAGRQPIATANSPQTSNYASTFTPQSVMNYNSQNYGNYSNAWSANQANQGNMGGLGAGLGMLAGGLLALPTGGMSVPMGAMLGGAGGGAFGSMFGR